MNTGNIMELLRARHAEDVYFEEPVIKYGKLRMDAWAMKKSWSHPRVIGYEVKLTRADFLQDHKMQEYLPYCNEMYLVCPRGIVDPREVNESFGLILVASTGTKLITRKKAPWRDIQIPEQFYRALLFGKASNDQMNMTESELQVMRRLGQLNDLEAYAGGQKALAELGGVIGRKIASDYMAMLRDKDLIESQRKELLLERQTWGETAVRLRKIFGYRFDRLIRLGDSEMAADLFSDKLRELDHPEKPVMDKIETLLKDLKAFKEMIGDKKRAEN